MKWLCIHFNAVQHGIDYSQFFLNSLYAVMTNETNIPACSHRFGHFSRNERKWVGLCFLTPGTAGRSTALHVGATHFPYCCCSLTNASSIRDYCGAIESNRSAQFITRERCCKRICCPTTHSHHCCNKSNTLFSPSNQMNDCFQNGISEFLRHTQIRE